MYELMFAIPKSRRWTVPPEQTRTALIIIGIGFVLWTLWCLLKAWFEDMQRREHMRNEMRKNLPRDKWNDPEAYGLYSWDRAVRKRKWKELKEEMKRNQKKNKQ